MLYHDDPRKVYFDDVACCALRAAFKHNPDMVSDLRRVIGEKHVELCEGILTLTPRLEAVFIEEHRTIFGFLAVEEKERVANDGGRIYCFHKIEEHIASLEYIIYSINRQSK